MARSIPSITQAASQVEGLSQSLEGAVFSAEAGQADPTAAPLAGRPILHWLRELWPSAGPWEGPLVTRAALVRLHQRRQESAQALEEELAARRAALESRLGDLTLPQTNPAIETARRELAAARDQEAAHHRALQEHAARARELAREISRRRKWLAGVAPAGLMKFVDAGGRAVSQSGLMATRKKLAALEASRAQVVAKVEVIKRALAAAGRRAVVAQEALDRAHQDLHRRQEESAARRGRLEEARASLDARAAQVDQARAEARKALGLLAEYDLAVSGLTRALEPCLAGERPLGGVVERIASEQARSQVSLNRAERLAGLLTRLEPRLERAAAQVTPCLAQVRQVNAEIQALQTELPLVVEPLTDPAAAGTPERARAAAGLSTLLARIRLAGPRARAAQAALYDLESQLAINLERGRRWQEAWRTAHKEERAARAQAEALIEELGQRAGEGDERRRALLDEALPAARALGRCLAAEALPALAAVAARALEMTGASQEARQEARRLAQAQAAPPAVNLKKPPAALKAHGRALRRLSGKGVDLDALASLALAARRWRALLAQPVREAIRRPAQEVALQLAGSLGRIAAERNHLAQAARSQEERATGLAGELAAERQTLAAAQEDIGRLSRLNQERLEELRAQQAELEIARQDQARLGEVEPRLAQAEEDLAWHQTELGSARKDQERLREVEPRLARAEDDLAWHQTELGSARRDQERLKQVEPRLFQAEDELARHQTELEAARRDQERLKEVEPRLFQAEGDLAWHRDELGSARKDQERLREVEPRLARAEADLAWHQDELAAARRDQEYLAQVVPQLDQARDDLDRLFGRLERSQKLNLAFKRKTLAGRALVRRARTAVEEMEAWQARSDRFEAEAEGLRGELAQARDLAARTQHRLEAASIERDDLQRALAEEQAARARQALDFLEGRALAVELAATRGEADRWAACARELGQALALTGLAHEDEVAGLRSEVARLSREAETLKEQLDRVARLVSLAEDAGELALAPEGDSAAEAARSVARAAADLEVSGAALAPRLVGEAAEKTLASLGQVRRRLRELGSATVGRWMMVAALAAGLTVVAPGTPSKATRSDSRLSAPVLSPQGVSQRLEAGPQMHLSVAAARHAELMGRAELEIDFVPLRADDAPLPASVKRRIQSLAADAGLAPEVLLASARAVYAGASAVEPEALDELAATARELARRHPDIFAEVSGSFVPPAAVSLVTKTSYEDAQHRFQDRLFREYRALGFTPQEALGALAANERALKQACRVQSLPTCFVGQVKTVPGVEAMALEDFLGRITPYIQEKLEVFTRSRGIDFAGDSETYARDLAFDIYCAAQRFQVPVSLMLAIAHQETWYANVLGDQDRSASPFQIFEPTRKLIRLSMIRQGFAAPPKGIQLQHHLTMATYMAAFHLRELMMHAYLPPKGKRPAAVNMDKVMKRYNGSDRYAPAVASRQRELARFLN